MPSNQEAQQQTREIFREKETMPGRLGRELRVFTRIKDLEKLREKIEADKARLVDLHRRAEAVIQKLEAIPLTDEQIKEFYLETLFASWRDFAEKVEQILGPDLNEVKAEVDKAARELENMNKLAPGKELHFIQEFEGIPAGSIVKISGYEPDDEDSPANGGLHKINSGDEIESEVLLALMESGDVQAIEPEPEPEPLPDPQQLEAAVDEMHDEDDSDDEEHPLAGKAKTLLQWMIKHKKKIALVAAITFIAWGASKVLEKGEVEPAGPEAADMEEDIDVFHLIPEGATSRQEVILGNFFEDVQEKGLNDTFGSSSSMDSEEDFLSIKRGEGNAFTVEYKTSEDQDFTTIEYQVDSDNQITLTGEEAPKKTGLAEILPSQLSEDQQQEVIGNLIMLERGDSDLEVGQTQEVISDLISLTRVEDNKVTLKYRVSSDSNFKQANYVLEEDGWSLAVRETLEEDDEELITRFRAEKRATTPPPPAPEAAPEVAPTPEEPSPEPVTPEEAEPVDEKWDSVEVGESLTKKSQWRINPSEGMSSLEWISPDGGEWSKPPFKIKKLGRNIGAYDTESGTYKYILILNSGGNLKEIHYQDAFGTMNVDKNLTPAPDGVTGALFDVRHAEPVAVVAQASGDTRDLGAPQAFRMRAEIVPGFEFADKYDTPEEQEQLHDQLEMIEGRIGALQDFRNINQDQFTDHYQEKFKEDLARLNRMRSNFLESVTNGEAEDFTFDNDNTYQEEMNYLYNRYKLIKTYSSERVRDLEEHDQLTVEFAMTQKAFLDSKNPVEAEQRLYVLQDLTQQANRQGHMLRPFRRVSLYNTLPISKIDVTNPLKEIEDKGINQESIDQLITTLEGGGYTDEQMQPLREMIARESDGAMRVFLEPDKEKRTLGELIKDKFKRPHTEFTPDQMDDLHADLISGNGSESDVREYHKELKSQSPQELQQKLYDSRQEFISLINDLDNTSPQEIYNLIERRAAMRSAYNDRQHMLQAGRVRGLDQTGYFDDRVFGPGGRGLELGLRDIQYRYLEPLSIKAFENSDKPEWKDIIEALRREGKYPPKGKHRINHPERAPRDLP